jgi:hypothetical protein
MARRDYGLIPAIADAQPVNAVFFDSLLYLGAYNETTETLA